MTFPRADPFLPEMTTRLGVESVLEIRARHGLEVEKLPMLHGDPFDRMLVAQARCVRLALTPRDAKVRMCPVTCVWQGMVHSV